MIEKWLFEALEALGTTTTAKVSRRLDGLQKKSVSWNLVSAIASKGHLFL